MPGGGGGAGPPPESLSVCTKPSAVVWQVHPDAWHFWARVVGLSVPRGGVSPDWASFWGPRALGSQLRLDFFRDVPMFTKRYFKSLPPAWELG